MLIRFAQGMIRTAATTNAERIAVTSFTLWPSLTRIIMYPTREAMQTVSIKSLGILLYSVYFCTAFTYPFPHLMYSSVKYCSFPAIFTSLIPCTVWDIHLNRPL